MTKVLAPPRSLAATRRMHEPVFFELVYFVTRYGRTRDRLQRCDERVKKIAHIFFLFLQLLRCFSSLGLLHYVYVFNIGYARMTARGLPHSDIPGSKCAWPLPEAYRSLLRPSSSF